MRRFFSLILATTMLFSMTTFIANAEESTFALNTLASVSANVGTFDTIEVGDKIFANRTYTFGENLPAYLIGKTYLRTNLADSVSATVMTDGYVYVITQVDGASDSQEAALIADGFTKIDTIAAATLWSAHKIESAVMVKEVKAGDTVSFSKWGVLIADFAINKLAVVSSTNGSFATVEKGNTIFSSRNYTFGDIPNSLLGLPYLKTGISSDVVATVEASGYVYVITQVDGTSNSQEASLTAAGFSKIATVGKGLLWSAHNYEAVVMAKEVEQGDVISYSYWGLLIANEGKEEFKLNNLATVMPTYETYGTIAVGEQIFTDKDTHVFAPTTPAYLIGKSYIEGSVAEGATFSVTEDGWVYIITPVEGKSTSVETELVFLGFEKVSSIDAKKLATTIAEPLVLMGKEVKAGEKISFGRWGIVVAAIDKDYTVNRLAMTPPTVIYNPVEGEYIDGNRLWQGIPSMTKDIESGRLWATWYSGGNGEGAYNFALLYTSTDDGKTWVGPVLAIDHEYPVRVFDPNLWMDPDGRMWMFWSQSRFHKDGVYGTWMMYTDNPESENPTWSTPMRVANGVTMNDPVVLSNGDWLLPTAIWAYENTVPEMAKETNSNVYISKDKGMTWEYLSSVPSYEGSRNCDENMIIEQEDGSLRMLIRTGLGIEESYSYDGGTTWTGATDADITKVVSRFYITRLSSGNQLLIYNDPPENGTKRSHMTAAISTDDGKTWSHKLVLDVRSSTTYPDAVEDADGNIYIIYDHTRTVNGEILMAKITEEDIIAGELVSDTSKLQVLINDNTVPKLVGDIDGDGSITIKDALDLIRVILNDETIENGDVNSDGKVGLADVIRVLKLLAK